MEDEQAELATLVERFRTDTEFAQQMGARLLPYFSRLADNVNTVSRLVKLSGEDLKEREVGQDILRAAVVFTHANLEDFLRTLASEFLPIGDENCLKEIPLAGTGGFGRSEKFVMGQLAQHRGKTVDEVLRQSVSEYLSRSNYNNTTEIAQLLTKLGFKAEQLNEEFPTIEQMMQRRHQIVHRADRTNVSGLPVAVPIERSQVEAWLQATYNFTARLILPVMQRIQDLLKKAPADTETQQGTGR